MGTMLRKVKGQPETPKGNSFACKQIRSLIRPCLSFATYGRVQIAIVEGCVVTIWIAALKWQVLL